MISTKSYAASLRTRSQVKMQVSMCQDDTNRETSVSVRIVPSPRRPFIASSQGFQPARGETIRVILQAIACQFPSSRGNNAATLVSSLRSARAQLTQIKMQIAAGIAPACISSRLFVSTRQAAQRLTARVQSHQLGAGLYCPPPFRQLNS
jgi:glucosamine 6-phosphate synthetase-like amidotransferase/phosphosugar isomerase protein